MSGVSRFFTAEGFVLDAGPGRLVLDAGPGFGFLPAESPTLLASIEAGDSSFFSSVAAGVAGVLSSFGVGDLDEAALDDSGPAVLEAGPGRFLEAGPILGFFEASSGASSVDRALFLA